MATSEQRSPFTHLLANLLLLLVGAYFLLNFVFISSCASPAEVSHEGAGCGGLNGLIPNLDFIPLISKPTAFLEGQGNMIRAEIVRLAYSFSWLTAILFALIMIGLSAFIAKQTSFENIAYARERYEADVKYMDRSNEGTFIRIALAGMAFFLINVIWGFFSFDDAPRTYMNMVHLRNRDLYLPSVFWGLLLLLSLAPLVFAVRNRLFKRRA